MPCLVRQMCWKAVTPPRSLGTRHKHEHGHGHSIAATCRSHGARLPDRPLHALHSRRSARAGGPVQSWTAGHALRAALPRTAVATGQAARTHHTLESRQPRLACTKRPRHASVRNQTSRRARAQHQQAVSGPDLRLPAAACAHARPGNDSRGQGAHSSTLAPRHQRTHLHCPEIPAAPAVPCTRACPQGHAAP